MQHLIAETQDGITVYVNLISSPAASTISHQPHILNLLKELALDTKISGAYPAVTIDMGRVVGNCQVVKTSSKDIILYARKARTTTYSRFVKTSKAAPTTHLSARLKKDANGDYELIDIWLGEPYPPVPGTAEETTDSRAFWDEHAFVYNANAIEPRTLTKTCPY